MTLTTITTVRVLSLGKILGSIYAGLGLIFGAILAIVSLFGVGPVAEGAGPPQVLLSIFVGGGAVIALPLVYGLFGFIGGLLVGTIYNFVAGIVGGLEIELSQAP